MYADIKNEIQLRNGNIENADVCLLARSGRTASRIYPITAGGRATQVQSGLEAGISAT